jgi:hypothetical protein
MADQSSDSKQNREISPVGNAKAILLETGSSVIGAGDTLVVTLASYGIKNFKAIWECVHDTYGSVVSPTPVANHATTAVSSGVLTITMGTLTTARTFLLLGT